MSALLRKFETLPLIILVVLLAFDGYFWVAAFSAPALRGARVYFLDVGQGDSELIIFSDGVKVLTDAGPSNGVLNALAAVLAPGDRYIDLAIITHPELDHFGGYQFLLDGGYRFGAFLANGRSGASVALWTGLMDRIAAQDIPLIAIGAGDRVRAGPNEIDVLLPDRELVGSAAPNDAAIVARVVTPDWSALFTADMGFPGEERLLAASSSRAMLGVDILKVGHHGSRYSSGSDFLRGVHPSIAAIEVGAKNTYGHPSKEALARIASSTRAIVFRTDLNGTIEVFREGGALKAKTKKGL